MPFTIIRQDITIMQVDAIVNAANTGLRMGGGVCGAIFRAAGPQELQAACNRVAPIQTGGAAITPGFRLPARYVIHAAGPVYSRFHRRRCEQQLRSAYLESLRLAERYHCESIAFPLISSGIYGYPRQDALRVATAAIRDFLAGHEMTVYLAVFDKSSFSVSKTLMGAVASYIDEHYVDEHFIPRGIYPDRSTSASAPDLEKLRNYEAPRRRAYEDVLSKAPAPADSDTPLLSLIMSEEPKPLRLDEMLRQMDEPFSVALLRLIDAKGKTDAEVYKRANIDRRLFAKIRRGNGYTPKKPTILALAIALELTLRETTALLERAGYALSHASKFDVIVEYFIISRNYNIFDINAVLFQYDQPQLGAGREIAHSAQGA